jgi:predicted acylesterase/phospholipase RssA
MPEGDPIARARAILRGAGLDPGELKALVSGLKARNAFGYARRILERARRDGLVPPSERVWVRQQHALCTYKDPDLPVDSRLDDALRILGEEGEDLGTTRDPETLGITGAIYKRRWEWDGQRGNLDRALSYYLRGHEVGPQEDYGYTGINAAYVLDLLASLEEREGGPALSAHAREWRVQAREIRQSLVAILPELPRQPGLGWLEEQYWFWATLGEAAFGIGAVDEARRWLGQAAKIPAVPYWERETTIRQLATLLSHHADEELEAPLRKVLEDFLAAFPDFNAQGAARALDSLQFGKVGLALSGGGFRASLFHIGVLARLAELDLLRHVEVLSCVSGGSIIGAHYYLEVRRLLQEKPDGTVTRQDYLEIVERVQREFLAGVQRNLRTRVATSILADLKMFLLPGYTRTHRLGELYESELFRRVPDGEGGEPRWLDQLFIKPNGEPESFEPKKHNWRRQAKVPILILNATTLNTGHNWQFTGSFMGEPPGAINSEVDGNERLRRLYYREGPPDHQHARLGYAVAASSCVPALFEPLALDGLYERRLVRLVDGGLYDNQGVAGLLEQGCSVMLVSDASGQMDSEGNPSAGTLAVLSRSNSILQERVRGAQYGDAATRSRAALLRGLMFVHLKKGLEGRLVDWLDCADPSEPPSLHQLTGYGLRKDLQARLAAIRTDLDSFSDVEAHALMTSGYSMARHELRPGSIPGIDAKAAAAPPSSWSFLRVMKALTEQQGDPELPRVPAILKVAAHRELKVWRLMKPLRVLGAAVVLALLVAVAWLGVAQWDRELWRPTVGTLVSTTLVLTFLGLGTARLLRWIRARKTLAQFLIGLGSIIALPFAWIHLLVFDRLYLSYGRVRR